MRGRAAPPYPGIYRVPLPPRTTLPCNSLRSPDVFRVSEIRQRFTGYHAKAVPVIPSRGTRKQQGNRRQPCLNYLLMLSGLDFCYVQPSVFCLEIVKRACENKHRVNTAVDLFCLKQGGKNSDICLKQGQGMRGRAAPPYPGIYRVPLPPRTTLPCNSLRSPDVFRVSEIRQRFTGYHAKAVPVIPSRGTRKQQGNRRQPCLNYLLMLSGLDFCYVQPSVFCLEIVKRSCENKHRVNTAVDLFVFE